MKRAFSALSPFGVLIAVIVVVWLAACAPPASPTVVNVNVTNVTTVTIVLGQPIQSPVAGCPAISRIRVSYPDVLPRGDEAKISATPLDSDGKPRDPKCDIDAGISWSSSPSQLLAIADRHAFETSVKASGSTGSAILTVDIGAGGTGKGASNSFPVTIS